MKPMKLHLYESFTYSCIAENNALFEMDRVVKRIKEETGTTTDEEIVIFSQEALALQESENSLFAGLGPITNGNKTEITKSIPEGDYLFYQFPDSSASGIRDAITFLVSYAKNHNIPLRDDRQVILRGVKEVGFYVLQLLFPLRSET
jgi:hypothetical protein